MNMERWRLNLNRTHDQTNIVTPCDPVGAKKYWYSGKTQTMASLKIRSELHLHLHLCRTMNYYNTVLWSVCHFTFLRIPNQLLLVPCPETSLWLVKTNHVTIIRVSDGRLSPVSDVWQGPESATSHRCSDMWHRSCHDIHVSPDKRVWYFPRDRSRGSRGRGRGPLSPRVY